MFRVGNYQTSCYMWSQNGRITSFVLFLRV